MSKRPSWIGQILGGRYKIEKLLGQGGMSAVYQAHDPNLRRTVAIKLIHSHLAADPQFVRRFEEEAAAVAQLRHPNIIQVYDFNHDEDIYYMVLEFLPGETLGERQESLNMREQKLSLTEIVQLMVKLTDAVHYAHEQGMVHRDLKPANVMIRENGDPVLMDFGIVKMVQNVGQTASGVIMGTMAYMAPEQIRGEKVDHRIDIYALGVILFEMLIGRKPFDGESTVTTMMQHLNEPPPDLTELDPTIPHYIAGVVYQALEKEPDNRYQSAAAMGQALRRAGQELGLFSGYGVGDTAVGEVPLDATEVYQPYTTSAGSGASTAKHSYAATEVHQITTASGGDGDTVAGAKESTTESLREWGGKWMTGAIVLVVLIAMAAIILGRQQLLAQQDDDGDGVTNVEEAELGTNPNNPDSDFDGLTDLNEKAVACLNPLLPDTDGDGVLDSADDSPCEGGDGAREVFARIVSIEAGEFEDTVEPSMYGSGGAKDGEVEATPTVEGARERRYVVTFETEGFVPQPADIHIHFYYNTVAEEDSGLPGEGPWEIHPNPEPFTRFRIADRPAEATEICVIAADGNHSFLAGTGECAPIPEDIRE